MTTSGKFEATFDSCPSCGGNMEFQETNPSYTPLKRIRLVSLKDGRGQWLTHAAKVAAYNQMLDKTIGGDV